MKGSFAFIMCLLSLTATAQDYTSNYHPSEQMSSLASTASATSPVHQTILVLFTDSAIAAKGFDVLQATIDSDIAWTNQAYVNSGVALDVAAIAYQRSPVQESGSGLTVTHSNIANSADVKALRDSLHADIVLTVTNESGNGYIGYGTLIYYCCTATGGLTQYDGFATIIVNGGLAGSTVAHEIGHTQGLRHDRQTDGQVNAGGGDNFGYRLCVTGGVRDIMSYSCSGAALQQMYSSPSLYVNGYPLGIDASVDPLNAANNVRTLNSVFEAQIAAVREPLPPPPPPPAPAPGTPSGLTATVSGGSVQLAWHLADSNATSVTVQRAVLQTVGNGKKTRWSSPVSVATLSGAATSYSNAPGAGTYRYYVYASNASGTSGTAGPVQVTL